MKSNTPLDYAAFQLSPKHSSNGDTEKLASGLVKPFVTQLKVVEEQVALPVQFIKLEVERRKNVESWFTKGTLEMDHLSGGGRSSSAAGADATKKELLRAIEVRLTALKHDLATTCARAAAAGFNHDTVADLHFFAERFGAIRLNEACSKFVSLYDRRPELFNNQSWKSGVGDQAIRSSYSSDMSIDDDPPTTIVQPSSAALDQSAKPHTTRQPPKSLLSSSASFPLRRTSTPASEESNVVTVGGGGAEEPLAQPAAQPSSRRLSVQDRISLFENKQKEVGSAHVSGGNAAIIKPELRRHSSDVSLSHSGLRRWSGASDMSIDLSCDKKETENHFCTSILPKKESPSIEEQTYQPYSVDQVCEEVSRTQLTVSSSVKSEESVGSNQLTSTLVKTQSWSSLTKSEDDSLEVPVKPCTQIKSFRGSKEERFRVSNQVKFKTSTVEVSDPEAVAGSIEGSHLEAMTSRAPPKKTAINSGYYSVETEEVYKKNWESTEKQFGESGLQKKKSQEQVRRVVSNFGHGYGKGGKLVQKGSSSMPVEAPVEQLHRSRLKGNQELNNELKIKANELEKLFAEHKLGAPEDQPNSMRRSNPSDIDADQTASLPHRNEVPELNTVFESPVPVPKVYGQDHSNVLQRSFSDDSRGKCYDSYTKRRDERLRELWGSNKAEKEARMKALNDSFEQNSAEMKAKLSWSANRQDLVFSARRTAERLRSFNARLAMKRDQPLDFGQLEDDEDLSGELKRFDNTTNFQGKKPSPIKNPSTLTSTPRTPAASIPRSNTKVASSSGRRRVQSYNILAQSVPNFLELRKENMKAYSVANKAAKGSQLRNYTRSGSTNKEMSSVKEEKPRRSQLLKNSPTPPESLEAVISKNVEQKPFLRKNNGIGPCAASGITKMQALMASEAMNNEEENNKLALEPDVMKDDDVEFYTVKTEDQDVIDGKMERLMNSESENNDASQCSSQVEANLVPELPTALAAMFPVQDSPGESPMSWNSRTCNPFSYPHEASDIDPSPMGSPASWNLQAINPAVADAARNRKKWGSAQKPNLIASSSGVHSRKDMTKGFKRLLKFGRKGRGTDSLADWISVTTSEGDDDTEDGRDPGNRSSEDLRKSRMGYSHGLPFEDSFNESDFFSNQVHTLQSSIPAPPANFRPREDHLSGSSIKAPRSFFSLSSFRSKGSESKLR